MTKVSPEELKKVIKFNRVSSYILTDIYWYTNSSIRNDTFSEEFELAEVTSYYKTPDSFDKITTDQYIYCFKSLWKIIFNQISTYFEPDFYNLFTGFRKNDNTQHCLLTTLGLWKEALDRGKSLGAVFIGEDHYTSRNMKISYPYKNSFMTTTWF